MKSHTMRTLILSFGLLSAFGVTMKAQETNTPGVTTVAPTTPAKSLDTKQMPTGGGSVIPIEVAKQELPKAAPLDPQALARMGLISTIEEARPLIKKYDDEQDALLKERLAAIQSMQGKSNEEKMKIKREIAVSQRDRFEKQRELRSKFELIQRFELEKTVAKSSNAADPK